MSCGHCVKSIENSVGVIKFVEKVNIQLDNGTVDVAFNNNEIDVQKGTNTIEDQELTVGA